jgi:thymidylate synthase
MSYFEFEYKQLIKEILKYGENRTTRNGITKALFGRTITVDLREDKDFIPLLNGRRMYPQGVFGEFAAFMHNAKSVEEFKSYGCNYWNLWADASGRLELDYSEQLFNFNGFNQLENLIKALKDDPYSRRHIISLWRPDRFDQISLHCCHYSYQFYIDNNNCLHMIWNQRSVDVMVGLPSDIILAYLWIKLLCNQLGYTPGTIMMSLGDCHIYEEHIEGAYEYIERLEPKVIPLARLECAEGQAINDFLAEDIVVYQYSPHSAIKFELKA